MNYEGTKWSPVTIPKELIDALRPYGLKRFLKVKPPILGDSTTGKRGFETGMYENLYEPDDPELLDWLEKEGNYGIAFGGIVVGLDLDSPDLVEKAHNAGIDTFEIQSGRGVGAHLLIISDIKENGFISRLEPEATKPTNLANIQFERKLLVGPNSNHFSGNKYTIRNNKPLQYVTKEQLREIFGDELHWTSEQKLRASRDADQDRTLLGADIPIEKFIDNWDEFHAMSKPGEWQGPHPIHGSAGGHNLNVNVDKNYWYCHRDNTGGSIVTWIAVKLDLLQCEEVGYKPIDKTMFRKIADFLRKAGYELETSEEDKVSAIEILMNAVLEEDIELFYDQYQDAYIRVAIKQVSGDDDNDGILPTSNITTKSYEENGGKSKRRRNQPSLPSNTVVNDDTYDDSQKVPSSPLTRHVTMNLRSGEFKRWVRYNVCWKKGLKRGVSTEQMRQLIDNLTGMAFDEGNEHTLYNRVATNEEGFWVDMCDRSGRAILITPEKWEIVDDPPILFKRHKHQKPLAVPDVNGDVEDAWHLLDYFNLNREDGKSRLMTIASILSYFIADISHPVLIVNGPKSTGKSNMFQMIRSVVDPSSVKLLKRIRSEEELNNALEHHWLAFFDNLTLVPSWMSDNFCTAVTGGGFTKRALYTDMDEIVVEYKRCIGLNGVNVPAQKSDLLDRSIILTLVPMDRLIKDKTLFGNFYKDLPKMLGGLLTVISRAMRLYSQVHEEYYQRLADFHHWGIAFSLVLGKTQKEFNSAYLQAVEEQNRESLNADNVAQTVLKFAEDKVAGTVWIGEPTDLFNELRDIAAVLGIDVKAKSFPKAPNILMRRLNMSGAALKSMGVIVKIHRRKRRLVEIDARRLVNPEMSGIKEPTTENVRKLLESDDLDAFSSENHEKRAKNSENQSKIG